METDVQEFVRKTIEQVQRFKDKKYPGILLSIKRSLSDAGYNTHFYNRLSLYVIVNDPRTKAMDVQRQIPAVIQIHSVYQNHIEIISPELPFIVLIYCANGTEFVKKAKEGGLIL